MKKFRILILSLLIGISLLILPHNNVIGAVTTENIVICNFENLATQSDIQAEFENVISDMYDGGTILDISSNNCYSETRSLYCRSDYSPTEEYTKAYLNLTQEYDYIGYINISLYISEFGNNLAYNRDFYIVFLNNGNIEARIGLNRQDDVIEYHDGSSWVDLGDYTNHGVTNKINGYYNINLTHITSDTFNYTVRNHTGVLLNYSQDSSPSSGFSTFDQIQLDGKENTVAGGNDYNEIWIDKIEIGGYIAGGEDYPYVGWIHGGDLDNDIETEVIFDTTEFNNTEWYYNNEINWIVRKLEIPIAETLYSAYGLSSADYFASINGNNLGNPTITLNEFGSTIGLRKHMFTWDNLAIKLTDQEPFIELNCRGSQQLFPVSMGVVNRDIDNDTDVTYFRHSIKTGTLDGTSNGASVFGYEPQYRLYYQEIGTIQKDTLTLVGLAGDSIEQYSSLGLRYTLNTSSSLYSYINISRAGFSIKDNSRGFGTWVITDNDTGTYYATLNRGGSELINTSFTVLPKTGSSIFWFNPRIINPGENTYCYFIYNSTHEGYDGLINIYYPNSNELFDYFDISGTDLSVQRIFISGSRINRIGEYYGELMVDKSDILLQRDQESFFVWSDELNLNDPWIDLEKDKVVYGKNEDIVIIGNHYYQGEQLTLEIREGNNLIEIYSLSDSEEIRETFRTVRPAVYKAYLVIDSNVEDIVEFQVVDREFTETDYTMLVGIGVILGIGSALALLIHPMMFPMGSGAMAFILSRPEMGNYALMDPTVGYGLIAILCIIAFIIWLAS